MCSLLHTGPVTQLAFWQVFMHIPSITLGTRDTVQRVPVECPCLMVEKDHGTAKGAFIEKMHKHYPRLSQILLVANLS